MPKRTAGQYELILLLHLFQNDQNLIFDHLSQVIVPYSIVIIQKTIIFTNDE
jgi:hypothetical protein